MLDWADPVPDTEVTARDYWIHVCTQYNRVNLVAQMALRTQLLSLKMVGLVGVDAYLDVFNTAHDCFVNMGVVYLDAECIFQAMNGLPIGVEWNKWHRMIKMILTGTNADGSWEWFSKQVYEEVQNQLTTPTVSEVASVAVSHNP
jgi:hypothetical protein